MHKVMSSLESLRFILKTPWSEDNHGSRPDLDELDRIRWTIADGCLRGFLQSAPNLRKLQLLLVFSDRGDDLIDLPKFVGDFT